jgi:membrane-bound metal-dependent hydrolase YbcI (DUF457 family)
MAAVVAGTAADLDQLSAYVSPSAFLAANRTFTHSIAGAIVLSVIFTLALLFLSKQKKDPVRTVFSLLLLVSLLHLAMDFCQNETVGLLWPFRSQNFSLDSVAHLDLWILLILLAAVLLPLLLGLVTEEIGAKSRAPRGRIGAALALVAVCIYIGGRFVMHGNAVALMESRTYRGELPRRVAAFAESDSPFRWHGIVETGRALHTIDVDLARASSFNPDSSVVSYKPEPSPALDSARNTEAARRFLQSARFPKASIEKTGTGFRVEIRDFRNRRDIRSGWNVLAIIETDANGLITNQELAWDPASRQVWWY